MKTNIIENHQSEKGFFAGGLVQYLRFLISD